MEVRRNNRKGVTGPKIQYLKQKVKEHHTDILVVNETRARTNEDGMSIFLRGTKLRATMTTASGRPAAGVTVLTGAEIIFIEGSLRESDPAGHFVLGTYKMHGIRVIIGGIYLDSTGQDQLGVQAVQQLTAHIQDLKQLYTTDSVILAGDFNVILHADQCNSGRLNKPRTAQELQDLLAEHQLQDVGQVQNNTEPTYRRHGDAGVYSRIDYVFTNLQHRSYTLGWGAMDHAYMTTEVEMPTIQQIGPARIRDWIIGSDRYLRLGREIIARTLLEHDQEHTYLPEQEIQNMITLGIPEGFERRIQLACPEEGITELHVLNVLVKKLQGLAGKLAREERDKDNLVLLQTDRTIQQLHKDIQTPHITDEERTGINNRITELKMHLKDALTNRATRDSARIDAFQNTNRGRMTRVSFTGLQEKKSHRRIDKLQIGEHEITDQDQIVQLMRDKYMQCTGQERIIDDNAVQQFLDETDITLPTLSPDQQDVLGDEITRDEVLQALQTAKVHSAPGPSGQTLGFYKFIFHQIPYLFTRCMNVIAFCDDILDSASLQWIKQRRIIYIPKPGKDPLSPNSYRPLSLLEVLYKIPAKILTDRIGRILPDISYPDQCGFVPGRGAQYSTLTAGHVIQDAENTGQSLQLLGVDISSAFDSISGECIRQCMVLNGFPSNVVAAVHNLTKLGIAQVEVNGKRGEQFVQKSGVGQGDPLSAFRFNIGTEPLLRALKKLMAHIAYRDIAGTAIQPSAYADDHLHAVSVAQPQDIADILHIYNRYTAVSGLCINATKTELLTVNTAPDLVHGITTLTGISTVQQLTLLGVRYTNTYQGSIQATYAHIDTKAIARSMRIATRAVHMLHRRLVIQSTLAPMYSHAFMAFGSTTEVNKTIADLIRKGMWTQTLGQEARQIRIQVAFQRVFAGYDMGGLNIAHPQQVNEGLMLNTLERLIHKDAEFAANMELAPNIIRITRGLLEYTNSQEIQQVYRYGGPLTWRHMAARINVHNRYLGGCMFAMARFLATMETRQQTWHTATLWGHSSSNPVLQLTQREIATLRTHGVSTVGQIYDPGDGIVVHSHAPLRVCPIGVEGHTWAKVTQIRLHMTRKQILRNGVHTSENTIHTVRRVGTFSHLNRRLHKEALAKEIKAPPSYHTRRRDGLPLPPLDAYCKAYETLMNSTFTSTAATAFNFAALNRTVWTAKKQAQSGNAGGGRQAEPLDSGRCLLCNVPEDTAHILADCDLYSYKLWERFNMHLTAACRRHHPNNGRIHVTFNNIMYFTPITALPREHTSRVTALLIELKRDIYVRRTERCLAEQGRGRLYSDQRLDMHISLACYKVMQVIKFRGKDARILDTLRNCCLGD